MFKKVVISAEGEGQRLDQVLSRQLELPRNAISQLFRQGHIKGDQTLKPSTLAKTGQVVKIKSPRQQLRSANVPSLPILYEDEAMMIIDKPAGLVVHLPEGARFQPTVSDFARSKGVSDTERDRVGIVHRLDKDTSGVLVIAKNQQAKRFLQRQFANRLVKKTYQALVIGRLDSPKATISLPVGRSRTRPTKRIVNPGGRSAVTHYRVLEELDGCSLLEVELETGRTHQIRVHFNHLGHPVVGDSLYGGNRKNLPKLSRQFLHAQRIVIESPRGKQVDVSSQLPPELAKYLEKVKPHI